MPRERGDLFRISNAKEREKVIVLAFEGNNTEELYFECLMNSDLFDESLVYLLLLKRPKSDTNSAPIHVFRKLKREAKDEYHFYPNDELWMIIDTDRWKNIPDIITECKKLNNMFVAVSNPCFEFWLLLHIKTLAEYSTEELDFILANKKVSAKKNYIDKEISNIIGSYNKSNPKLEQILPSVNSAIKQAKELDIIDEDFPSGLGSHIYKVVEKLIKKN